MRGRTFTKKRGGGDGCWEVDVSAEKMGWGANTPLGSLCDHKLPLKRIVIVKWL